MHFSKYKSEMSVSSKRKLEDIDKVEKTKSNLLKDMDPELFKMLLPHRNINVDLNSITYQSRKKLTWTCIDHQTCDEHVWDAQVANMYLRNQSCPYCNTINGIPTVRVYCKCSRKEDEKILPEEGKSKKCSNPYCQKVKPLSEFHNDKNTKDGRVPRCKICTCNKQQLNKSIKSAVIKLFLEGKKCCDCDENDQQVFEFDHVDNNKAIDSNGNKVKGILQMSMKKIVEEMRKCDVVCGFCHRLRTHKRRPEKKVGRPGRLKIAEFVNNRKIKISECQKCVRKVTIENCSAFDFDHLEEESKVDRISKMVSDECSVDTIETEIAKCQLLCINCHKLKTAKDHKWRKLSDFSKDIIIAAKKILARI